MIYLMRVDRRPGGARRSRARSSSGPTEHRIYDDNGYPETPASEGRPVWVGDFWDLFYAGHLLELRNLKAIAEYRQANGLPIKARMDAVTMTTTLVSLDRRRRLPAGEPGPGGLFRAVRRLRRTAGQHVMFKAPAIATTPPRASHPPTFERANAPMARGVATAARLLDEVDVLIAHTQLPDLAVVGNGGEIAHRLGINPEDGSSTCTTAAARRLFLYAMKLARQILDRPMLSAPRSSALVQNAAGQIFTQPTVRQARAGRDPRRRRGASDCSPNPGIRRSWISWPGTIRLLRRAR